MANCQQVQPASRSLAFRVLRFLRRSLARNLLGHRVRQTLQRLREIEARLPAERRLLCIGLVEHLGDIVACEPVIRWLRQKHPDAYLVWLVRGPYRELVLFHPELDEVVTVSSVAEHNRLAKALGDQLVDLHLSLCHCTDTGWVHDKRRGDPSITVFNYFEHGSLLEIFTKSAGLPALTEAPQLHLPASVQSEMDSLAPIAPFLVVHTKSNDETKDWPTEKWVELVRWLAMEFRMPVVEVGLRSTLSKHVPGLVDFCGRLSVLQTAALIRRAAGFLGVDSGPAHLANALRRPSVVLFGRYRAFNRYLPYTGFLREHAADMVLQWEGPIASLPIEEVAARARKVFAANKVATVLS